MGVMTETKEIINIVATNKESFDEKFKTVKANLENKGLRAEILNIDTRKTAHSDLILATVRGYIKLGEVNNES